MIDYHNLESVFRSHFRRYDYQGLHEKIVEALDDSRNGRLKSWKALLRGLPAIHADRVECNSGSIRFICDKPLNAGDKKALLNQLRRLRPWRKGPYDLFGIHIDTEWRSDWKWDRLEPHLPHLNGMKVLDVGCGNGYHCWRSLGRGAKLVIGIDPYLLSVAQFQAIRHFAGIQPVFVLPLALEELHSEHLAFDVVFSMGVLYHRRSPIDHLFDLRALIRPGGTLILETLVIEEQHGQLLMPEDRYAKMRNVWFIPSCSMLSRWLARAGYENCRFLDVTKTTTEEQRSTEWMAFESLSDFLHPDDDNLTIEGYPAPRRALFMAEVP
jgi:tRNA (mo5U34)-methyltransferase